MCILDSDKLIYVTLAIRLANYIKFRMILYILCEHYTCEQGLIKCDNFGFHE